MNIQNAQKDVAQFTKTVKRLDLPSRPDPSIFRDSHKYLRHYLIAHIKEEVEELERHLSDPPADELEALIAVGDDFIDILYVTLQAANHVGLRLQPLWEEIQRANMQKVGGAVIGGHLQKPEGWTPPNLRPLIEDQIDGRTAIKIIGTLDFRVTNTLCGKCGESLLRAANIAGPIFCGNGKCPEYLLEAR